MYILERSEKGMNFNMDELRLGRNALDISPKNQERNREITSRWSGFSKMDLKIWDIFITVFNEQTEEIRNIDIQRLNAFPRECVDIQILNSLHREIVDTLGSIAEENKKGDMESVIEIDVKKRNEYTSERWDRWDDCVWNIYKQEINSGVSAISRNWERFGISELKTLEWMLVVIECLVKNKSYYLLDNYLMAYKSELLSELKKREGQNNIDRFSEER